ncbi:hypothetical protein K2X14_05635 [Acetobacter sp. TBRC 12305]|uniref:Uncharacterized protein n=1 Tax=Acetobacter garciniae TaxID=2817435 RepID=A0A939HJL6_9PROT|nr:hypothetical protein [Acetobacter garciniae]MBO1324632.1 hypothetical protein [Acetobacter garciniae]MBX0344321.1 hypothetical protein [Acetobacter garciniae]
MEQARQTSAHGRTPLGLLRRTALNTTPPRQENDDHDRHVLRQIFRYRVGKPYGKRRGIPHGAPYGTPGRAMTRPGPVPPG